MVMAYNKRKSMDISSIILILLILFAEFLLQFTDSARPPAVFMFGDSILDVGTNSYIPNSTAKADFPYYGIDFHKSHSDKSNATGRFSNGFNTADYISKLMGFERSPYSFLYLKLSGQLKFLEGPHCSLKRTDLILSSLRSNGWMKTLECVMNIKAFHDSTLQTQKFRGVNFASAGSGILDTTGKSDDIVSMSEQVNQFITVQNYLTATIGESSAHYVLSESVYIISIGNNDIIKYFEINSTEPNEEFIENLIIAYEAYIKVLYDLGARKFGVVSVIPTGCCPAQRLFNATRGCRNDMNDFCLKFHYAVESLLYKISLEYNDFRYSYGNAYDLLLDIIRNPARYDLKYVKNACCGNGTLNAEVSCNIRTRLCKTRSEYLFWDHYHPSEAASYIIANMLYRGELGFVSPISFAQLAANL